MSSASKSNKRIYILDDGTQLLVDRAGVLTIKAGGSLVVEAAGGLVINGVAVAAGDASVWRDGVGAPSDAVGTNGDYYLRTSNGDVYTRAAGVYSVVGNIKGAAGTNGTNGTNGTDGDDGEGVPVGGTAGQVLKKVSGTDFDTEWDDESGGGGGLTQWTESSSTTSPNDTTGVVSFHPIEPGGSNGADAAIVPLGIGALLASVPDSTSTGGNKRGNNAVDLQQIRTDAAQVASGSLSTIGGGRGNVASGGNASTIPGGMFASTRGIRGMYAYSSGANIAGDGSVVPGRAQKGAYCVRTATIADAPASLTARGDVVTNGAAAGNGGIVLPNDTTYAFTGIISARDTTTGDSAAYSVQGCIKRGANAAATAIVGSVIQTALGADAGASAWTVSVTADTTNGGLQIQVSGASGGNVVNWHGVVDTSEIQN